MPKIKDSPEISALENPEKPKISWRDEQLAEQGKHSNNLLFAEVRVAHAYADELKDRIKQRKRFANVFVWIAIIWLFLVLLVVVLDALASVPLEQSDTVIIALLGTGATTAIAPAIIVAKFLFPVPKNGK